MTKFDELAQVIDDARGDVEKFESKGNKAAGTRVRKAMQSVKQLAQEIRIEVQSAKNG